MFGDDAAGDGEAKARAAIFRGEMRQEELVFVFGRDAVARVGDFDFDSFAVAGEVRRDGDATQLGAFEGFSGVVDQIDDDAADELGVSSDDGERGGEIAVQHDAVEAAVENVESLGGDGVDVGGGEARGGEARELREFVDQRFEGLHFALDQMSTLGNERGQVGAIFAAARGRGAFEMAQEALRGELNGREGIFDFVGDALGDFLPSGGFLRAEELGDVIDNDDEAGIGAAGAERADGDGGVIQAPSGRNFEFL